MRDAVLQSACLAALRPAPDFSALRHFSKSNDKQLRRLLRWLDQSGLALYFLHQLQQHQALANIPGALRGPLESRQISNRQRTLDMLGEFRYLLGALRDRNVPFCALKGFTLTPDFCPALDLRHQTDFDFLIAPEWLENARQALKACGYAQSEVRDTGEVTFCTPLNHIPSAHDDIYARPRHREVDLVLSLRQQEHGVSLDFPPGCLHRAQEIIVQGMPLPALSLDDRFTLQVMHAFKHFLGSWVRLSWLVEIGRFIDLHFADASLWQSIAARCGRNPRLRNAFGLIVSLTQALFARALPETLDGWCVRPLPAKIATWVATFGPAWATSGLDGSKLTLFIHSEFVDDPSFWHSYLVARIFPFGRRSSTAKVPTSLPGARIKARASQWLHSSRRILFHARELASLPVEAIRWNHALRFIARQRLLLSARSDDGNRQPDAPSGPPLANAARFRN